MARQTSLSLRFSKHDPIHKAFLSKLQTLMGKNVRMVSHITCYGSRMT